MGNVWGDGGALWPQRGGQDPRPSASLGSEQFSSRSHIRSLEPSAPARAARTLSGAQSWLRASPSAKEQLGSADSRASPGAGAPTQGALDGEASATASWSTAPSRGRPTSHSRSLHGDCIRVSTPRPLCGPRRRHLWVIRSQGLDAGSVGTGAPAQCPAGCWPHDVCWREGLQGSGMAALCPLNSALWALQGAT